MINREISGHEKANQTIKTKKKKDEFGYRQKPRSTFENNKTSGEKFKGIKRSKMWQIKKYEN